MLRLPRRTRPRRKRNRSNLPIVGHFCVNCGAPLELRSIEGRELEACANDGYVLWRDPKGAPAGVVGGGGGIVLGPRGVETAHGGWGLPGGVVHDDEKAPAAAGPEGRGGINLRGPPDALLRVYHLAE